MHIPLEADLENSFAIRAIDHNMETSSCRLSYHRIILVEEGQGLMHIDDKYYPLADRQLFLISKGQILDLNPAGMIKGLQISFGDCFWERAPASTNNCKAVLFDSQSDNHCLELDQATTDSLLAIFYLLEGEFRQPGYINQLDALAAYLKVIMIKIANIAASFQPGYENTEKQIYRRFLALVAGNDPGHDVGVYANKLNIRPRRLTEICKRSSGRSAKEIINDHLLDEAKRFLQFSNASVKEIAYQLNFASSEQFSHFFKRNLHINPSSFRSAGITG
ncbi:MAG TPA: helix-turn-helix domain-containing protein [Pedobacter sp.]|uniref:helix-turn-helix domain-containing protein n=1 Tax=Pedobacter sp. TaxID=1411316 RepID=UPI002B7FE825|nr:helix-turn-helix domain-containing protein [Pedobacter sp.]HMI01039.1 helix-turn-helix domain-containing protein [Pedobacter sp.]